ncbi:hypothetical protein [Enterococcus avium]|uniref:hypothetical protein n=1 Tax=Enterococcus avium TaxID=33945 RepID=UPI0022E30F7F|nr:hypothetical protein [Enterococcus avium]
MVNVFKNTWDRPKKHSRYHKSNKKNEAKKDSAVRSLLFKILSVFVIGFLTKKIKERKK